MVTAAADALSLAIICVILSYAGMPGQSPMQLRDGESGHPPGPLRAAMQHLSWRVVGRLSSGLDRLERFLAAAGFDRAPWLAVAFGLGIAAWFILANHWQWLAMIFALVGTMLSALLVMREDGRFPFARQAVAALALAASAGCGTVWTKSELLGAPPITRTATGIFTGTVTAREEQSAEGRVRLVLTITDPGAKPGNRARTISVRINVPLEKDSALAQEGALVRLRARLVPPAPPMLPGSYDFARAAWFQGLSATGTALGPVEVLRAGKPGDDWLAQLQRRISTHVRAQIPGSAGGIAAAFSSGDRGGIAQSDEDAMRDAGLTHLLSISGLHVSAVIGATYLLAMWLLALWPWLTLRFRLPLIAATLGAFSGIAYTLLTGAEVPTVRSCIGAVLVLAALALGREPLSLRMLAVAAFFVMLLWPEAVVGPSFQMSFASVIAIIALHASAPVRAFLALRDEPWWLRMARSTAMLLATGLVIELALMPIGLFHFHRAGIYGAMANVIAIPLTTFVSMPLIALALTLDAVGAGAPAWWLAGKSLGFLLWLAAWVAAKPGAVTYMPAMGQGAFALFLAGSLWLALWHGKTRLWGFGPVLAGTALLATITPPDLLISGDGRHVGITGLAANELVVLRESRSDYARDNLTELAGMRGAVALIDDWPGAHCSKEFCALEIERGGRQWHLLLSRGTDLVPFTDLVSACAAADIVADRRLPAACRPHILKADRNLLDRTGGLAIDLDRGRIDTVAANEGRHGWWQPTIRTPYSGGRARRQIDPAGSPGDDKGREGDAAGHNAGGSPRRALRNDPVPFHQ
ncbi:MAG: ComEC/Rec2 family competence protein [Novosphingobium sp.]